VTDFQTRRQNRIARTAKRLHRRFGMKVDYTLFTVPEDATSVTLPDIFIKVTPTSWKRTHVGRTQIVGTEDLFVVSRDYLVSGGTKYEPSNKDHFVEDGTTEPVFYVQDWEENQERPGTYTLLVGAEKGFNIDG
jgi:hypothetical protein